MTGAHLLFVLATASHDRDVSRDLLGRAERAAGARIVDAVVLRSSASGAVAVAPPCGEAVGPDDPRLALWIALAAVIGRDGAAAAKRYVDAGFSRSFLDEVRETLAGGADAVALVVEAVDLAAFLTAVSGPPISRVIYGVLPEHALACADGERQVFTPRG